LNLKNQEVGCRRLADQRGIPVAEVILGPGESGRTADRPSFVRLLSYCKSNKRKIGYVIVESLSRFARNVADQGAAIAELRENGITLLSVAEPNVDNTAAGRMAAGVHGVFNQYFSDALSEKMKERSAASVRAGRWPWAAPIGYLNDLKQSNGANIKPDPVTAPFIHEAFELYATGRQTKIQVLTIITGKGLKTKRGQNLTPQTFDALLRKPIYAGWVYSSSVAAPVKGPASANRESRVVRHSAASALWTQPVERTETTAQPSIPTEALREVWHLWNAAYRRNEQRQAQTLRELLVSEFRVQSYQGVEVRAGIGVYRTSPNVAPGRNNHCPVPCHRNRRVGTKTRRYKFGN
jgi:DNA invertase Pin-like site-specific DNA recombinase